LCTPPTGHAKTLLAARDRLAVYQVPPGGVSVIPEPVRFLHVCRKLLFPIFPIHLLLVDSVTGIHTFNTHRSIPYQLVDAYY